MKQKRLPIPSFLLSVCCALLVLKPAYAQSSKSRALTLDEYKKAKTLAIKDLENDTYVKFENAYVLDRYEMKPPYVFKYSDGIERRIYLYRLLDNRSKQPIGMVAVYYTPGNGKKFNVCIPSAESDKAVWGQYIDDLKEYSKEEAAFGSAYAYVMSREMITLVNGSTNASNNSNRTDYDVCFPADASVSMADGSKKRIAEVKVGERIAAYNPRTGKLETTKILEVQTHEGKVYQLTTILLADETITASATEHTFAQMTRLQATPNHPVLTQNGRKPISQLKATDLVYVYEATTGTFKPFKVYLFTDLSQVPQPDIASKVYNLITDKGNYLINDATVLDK